MQVRLRRRRRRRVGCHPSSCRRHPGVCFRNHRCDGRRLFHFDYHAALDAVSDEHLETQLAVCSYHPVSKHAIIFAVMIWLFRRRHVHMLQKRSLVQQFAVEDLCGLNGEFAPTPACEGFL